MLDLIKDVDFLSKEKINKKTKVKVNIGSTIDIRFKETLDWIRGQKRVVP